MIEYICKCIIGSKIEDFIITGTSDTDEEIIEFIPDYTLMYFEINNRYLCFESVEQFSKLKLSVTDKINYHEVSDEDFKYSFMSIIDLLLINGIYSTYTIDKVILYNGTIENETIICDAAKITMSSGQTIFFDPSNLRGISIGDSAMESNWIDNNGRDFVLTVIQKNQR